MIASLGFTLLFAAAGGDSSLRVARTGSVFFNPSGVMSNIQEKT
jgi:hypothetical protein